MKMQLPNVSLIIKGKKISIVMDTIAGPVVVLETLLSEKKDKSGLRGAGFAIKDSDGKFQKWVPTVNGIAVDKACAEWIASKERQTRLSEPELEV